MEYLGHEYVEIAGVKWATMNVGANSITDTGLYFQWGDTQGYTASQVGSGEGQKYFGWKDYKYGNGTNSPGATGMTKYNSTDGKTVLEASDDAVIANWGGSWRMPTTAEFQALGNAVNTAWTANYQGSGVAGLICTDKTDSSKVLFFPACGYCSNGSVYFVGSVGDYWSSSLRSSNVQYAYILDFYDGPVSWQNNYSRFGGFPVRGVFSGEPKEDLTREELNYSSNATAIYEEDKYTLPVLTNVHNLELTYNSSNTNVATINSSGVVSIVGNGTTTISASFAGDDEYNAKTINYVLIVDIKKYLDYKGLETFKQQLDIEFNKKANSSTVQGIIDDIGDNSTLNSVKGRIKVIEDKIPSAASSDNQLADKNFVNSSVATNTATYKGNYNVVSDLELSYNSTHLEIAQALALEISLADNNDYCFVLIPTSNSSPEEIKVIERYKFDETNWSFEYSLNNSGFTSDLWKAINSGITSGLITTFNNKYDKPSGGIPKTDLSSTIQSSLDKADTALQLHQDISGKADKTATVSDVAYDGTNKKITKTINGTTSDVVTVSTIKSDLNLPHDYVSAVEEQNFSEAQKARARKNIGVISQEQLDALTRHTRKSDFSLDVLKQAVADQNLEKYGLKVGDYKTINGHDYVIAGLNPMKGIYEQYRVNKNHVGLIVIPHTKHSWNDSGNTYTGSNDRGAGYKNSDLHAYLKSDILPMCQTDLGSSNLIAHSKLLSSTVNTSGYNRFGEASGCSSSWAWESDCYISALSEVQVYGSTVWSSSGFDTGEACRQLDVFRVYNMNEIFNWEYPWLRDVASASYACDVSGYGYADNSTASYAYYVAGLILFN